MGVQAATSGNGGDISAEIVAMRFVSLGTEAICTFPNCQFVHPNDLLSVVYPSVLVHRGIVRYPENVTPKLPLQ